MNEEVPRRRLDETDLENLRAAADKGFAHVTDVLRLVAEVQALQPPRKLSYGFTVWYFKPSGKLYIEGTFVCECTPVGDHRQPYMYDAVDFLIESNKKGKLPALSSGRWDGFILVNAESGFPILITPDRLQ